MKEEIWRCSDVAEEVQEEKKNLEAEKQKKERDGEDIKRKIQNKERELEELREKIQFLGRDIDKKDKTQRRLVR